jgi:hypothetical protein
MAEWAEAAGRAKVTHGVEASNVSWLRRRGAATARGASRDSQPGDPGSKVPRDAAHVAQEQQILHGAWSVGFIDGGEAACQRLSLSGAMERVRALVQRATGAVLDELERKVAARAAGSREVEWGELRAALEDEGLSVEELRSELRHDLQPDDGAQGGRGRWCGG